VVADVEARSVCVTDTFERIKTSRTPSKMRSTTNTASRAAHIRRVSAAATVSSTSFRLSCANDVQNLWPQTSADSEMKDRVEHTLTLQQARAAIARDWTRTPVEIRPAR